MQNTISPILLASPYKEKVQHELKNDSDWAKLFTGHHLEPGIVTYDNDDGSKTVYLLTKEAIAKMRSTAEGKPIVGRSGNYDHKKVQPSDFVEGEVDGVVVESFDNPEVGWEDVKFIVWDKDTKARCKSGFQLSCAYVPTETEDKPGLWHNCPYDAVILNGNYTHFAVVPNPRYEGATILANSLKGGIVDTMVKAVLKVVPLPKLKEILNSLEDDAKKNAEVSGIEKIEQKSSTTDDAPVTATAPKLPLGGGDVTPDPALIAAGVDTAGKAATKVEPVTGTKEDTAVPAVVQTPKEAVKINTPESASIKEEPKANTPEPAPIKEEPKVNTPEPDLIKEEPKVNAPELTPMSSPESKVNTPESTPEVKENAPLDAGELREHIAATFTQELLSGNFSPALQALLEKGAATLGWDIKRYTDQARGDARIAQHGVPNAVKAEVKLEEVKNAAPMGGTLLESKPSSDPDFEVILVGDIKQGASPFATWIREKKNPSNCTAGHYFQTAKDATRDFEARNSTTTKCVGCGTSVEMDKGLLIKNPHGAGWLCKSCMAKSEWMKDTTAAERNWTNSAEVCPSCTGEMKILGNMGGVTHSQCNACGEVVHSSKEEPKANAEDKCLKCDHLLNGHSEFGCNVPGCECVAEVKNSHAETSEEYGRKRWDATPVEKRVQLLNSVHRKQPGDVALSFWNRRNWDELSNSIRKDLMRKSV